MRRASGLATHAQQTQTQSQTRVRAEEEELLVLDRDQKTRRKPKQNVTASKRIITLNRIRAFAFAGLVFVFMNSFLNMFNGGRVFRTLDELIEVNERFDGSDSNETGSSLRRKGRTAVRDGQGDEYEKDLRWDEQVERRTSEEREERKLENRERRRQDHLLDLPSKKNKLGEVIPDLITGKCRSRHAPDLFKMRVWKAFELDVRNAPLNASLISNGADAMGLGSSSGAIDFGFVRNNRFLMTGMSEVAVKGEDSMQLTVDFLETLPVVRGSRVMKMLLEGDIPNGVSPRLEIPEEYVIDKLIGSFPKHKKKNSSNNDSSNSDSSSSGSSSSSSSSFPRFKTCAVVGTSGTLKDKSLGEQIDKHEAVFRTDLGRTIGFERDVGLKTNFDFAMASDLRSLVLNENAFLGREEDDDVEPEDDSEANEENEGAKQRNAKRRRRRNALRPQTLELIARRNSTIVLHELFSRAALRGTYPPFIRAMAKIRNERAQQQQLQPNVIAVEPRLLVHILQTFHRVANALDQYAHESGAPSGAKDISSSRAQVSLIATLFALQTCEKVTAYGLAPPLAIQSSRSSETGKTQKTYRNYWDKNFAHVGTLKKHSKDSSFEVLRAIAQWPCSFGVLKMVDPRPSLKSE